MGSDTRRGLRKCKPYRILLYCVVLSTATYLFYMYFYGKMSKSEVKGDHLEEKLSRISEITSFENEKIKNSISEMTKVYESLRRKISSLEGTIKNLESKHDTHETVHRTEMEELTHNIEETVKLNKQVAAILTPAQPVTLPIPKVVGQESKSVENGLEVHGANKEGNKGASTVSEGKTAVQGLGLDTVLLVICGNRPQYLKRTLAEVVKYHPKDSVPVLISEDGESSEVGQVISEAKRSLQSIAPGVPMLHLHHPNHMEPAANGYFKLCRHFKWALDQVFSRPLASGLPQVQRVIILEEDLKIAPDFFDLFEALAPKLDSDESLLAVSAWNDNGLSALVRDPKQLYRSDFFPGLGWMLTRRLWDELSPKWPKAYWDDWLREPAQRKHRHILRPEICRTFHFGENGVSNAQYSQYLTDIKLNDVAVKFKDLDLSYLDKATWDVQYVDRVRSLPVVTPDNYRCPIDSQKEVRLNYDHFEDGGGRGSSFEDLAHWSGAMDNIKAMVPRTAYKGIVSVWKGDCKIHLTPDRL